MRSHSNECLWCNKSKCNITDSRGIRSLATAKAQNDWEIQGPLADTFALVYGRWQGKANMRPPRDREGDHSARPLLIFQSNKKIHARTFFGAEQRGKKIF